MDKTNFSAFCLIVLVAFAIAMCSVMFVGYTINNENIAFADNITDLTGYTWVANNSFSLDYDDVFSFNFNFTSNNMSFTNWSLSYNWNDSYDDYMYSLSYIGDVGRIVYSDSDGWLSNDYKTIVISGGSDVSNSTLISVLQVQGTLTAPSSSEPDNNILDLSGYTWVGNNSLNATYTLEDFNINFTCNNVSYNILNFNYDVDDDEYNQLLYLGTGVPPVIAYDWFEVNPWSDDIYKTISIQGGTDSTSSFLITWLSNNGTLTASSNPEPDEPSEPDEPDNPSNPSQDYLDGYDDGYEQGYNDGRGSIYTGVLSDYTILSNYSTLGINNNALNISDISEVLNSPVVYSNFVLNGYTINYQKIEVVGSNDDTGKYTLTLTGSTGYSGYKISSFNINENSIYKFMFNPEDSFNICISVPDNGSYLYWTYSLQTDGYINGVPYMDLTPYIKPWASHTSCDIYLYNPNVRLIGAQPQTLVLHNITPIYGLVGNNLIVDNSNGNYNQGFKDGKLQGEQIGYTKGLSQGINSSENNFLGLFSAVLDAPISVISQTLNFDLLGFNLRDFFFSMVSIAVILFILRLIL